MNKNWIAKIYNETISEETKVEGEREEKQAAYNFLDNGTELSESDYSLLQELEKEIDALDDKLGKLSEIVSHLEIALHLIINYK